MYTASVHCAHDIIGGSADVSAHQARPALYCVIRAFHHSKVAFPKLGAIWWEQGCRVKTPSNIFKLLKCNINNIAIKMSFVRDFIPLSRCISYILASTNKNNKETVLKFGGGKVSHLLFITNIYSIYFILREFPF